MVHTKMKVTTFKERFSELLGESDKSTADLAKALHVSRQTVSAWKTGERSPKEPTIIAVANYFRVDEMWLMGFDVEKSMLTQTTKKDGIRNEPPKSNEARIISGGIDRMPPERREQALKILQVAFAEYADYFKEDNNDDA